jgi:hypothetical protein
MVAISRTEDNRRKLLHPVFVHKLISQITGKMSSLVLCSVFLSLSSPTGHITVSAPPLPLCKVADVQHHSTIGNVTFPLRL